MVQVNLAIFISTYPSGPVHVPTLLCQGRSAENSSSRFGLPRKRRQPWKVRLGQRWVRGILDLFRLILPSSLYSVEAPSKPARTSEPQLKRQKKTKAPQDVEMKDLEDES